MERNLYYFYTGLTGLKEVKFASYGKSNPMANVNCLFQVNFVIYYVDASILLENNQWRIFHILTSEDVDEVIHLIYLIKWLIWHSIKSQWTLFPRYLLKALMLIFPCVRRIL